MEMRSNLLRHSLADRLREGEVMRSTRIRLAAIAALARSHH